MAQQLAGGGVCAGRILFQRCQFGQLLFAAGDGVGLRLQRLGHPADSSRRISGIFGVLGQRRLHRYFLDFHSIGSRFADGRASVVTKIAAAAAGGGGIFGGSFGTSVSGDFAGSDTDSDLSFAGGAGGILGGAVCQGLSRQKSHFGLAGIGTAGAVFGADRSYPVFGIGV